MCFKGVLQLYRCVLRPEQPCFLELSVKASSVSDKLPHVSHQQSQAYFMNYVLVCQQCDSFLINEAFLKPSLISKCVSLWHKCPLFDKIIHAPIQIIDFSCANPFPRRAELKPWQWHHDGTSVTTKYSCKLMGRTATQPQSDQPHGVKEGSAVSGDGSFQFQHKLIPLFKQVFFMEKLNLTSTLNTFDIN